MSLGLYSCAGSMDEISVAIHFFTPCLQNQCQASINESNKDSGSYILWYSFTMYIFGLNEELQTV